MKLLFVVLLAATVTLCLAACHNSPQPGTPSTTAVDSATAAAPDTIKAISLDSMKR